MWDITKTNRSERLLKRFRNCEGVFTKIITEDNKSQYENLFEYLDANEIPLIVCRFDHSHWTLLTNKKLLMMDEKGLKIILNVELSYAGIDMPKVFSSGLRTLRDVTNITVKDINNNRHELTLEKGAPLAGVLDILHFIAIRKVG